MQKSSVIAASLTLAVTSAFASDAMEPLPNPSAALIEQCIRDNAAKVEGSIADLNQATDFLVNKVCATPIAQQNAERLRQQTQKVVEIQQKLCDAQTAARADAKPDAKPVSPDYCMLVKNSAATFGPREALDAWSTPVYGGSAPVAAVALAAQLLIDLRAARKHHQN